MGQRVFEEEAPPTTWWRTTRLRSALEAVLLGLQHVRRNNDMTFDGAVAFRQAGVVEVVALVERRLRRGGGVFELADESASSWTGGAERSTRTGGSGRRQGAP